MGGFLHILENASGGGNILTDTALMVYSLRSVCAGLRPSKKTKKVDKLSCK